MFQDFENFKSENGLIEQPVLSDKETAWLESRVGRITASRVKDLMSKSSRKAADWSDDKFIFDFGKAFYTYVREKLAEKLTGECKYVPETFAMMRGKETEHEAIEAVEKALNVKISKTGEDQELIMHKSISMLGATPDGVCDKYVYEVKNPNTDTHLSYFWQAFAEGHPYFWQVQTQLACSGKESAVFASYDSRIKDPAYRLKIIFVERSDNHIKALETRSLIVESAIENYLLKTTDYSVEEAISLAVVDFNRMKDNDNLAF